MTGLSPAAVPAEDAAGFIPAATVLLLRDGAPGSGAGLEVFMVVRHHRIDSFSGALVFPGGKVDPGDGDPALVAHCRGTGLDDPLRAFRVAAVREAFEECGVLLAHEAGAADLLPAERLAEVEAQYRAALQADEADMRALCAEQRLELACDRLVPFAHWITPKGQPKVFDTHFFLAPAPPDQVALHDGEEASDSIWIGPAEALAQADAGRRTVVFPTRMNLTRLARSPDRAAALADAAATPVVSVRPRMEPRGDDRILRIPPEAGYGVSEVLVTDQGRRFTVLK